MPPLPKLRLDHALITGASSGIGLAFAEALAARARRLTLTARREERLDALAERLLKLHPGLSCRVIAEDLAVATGPARLVARVRESGEPAVDLLVNNAGFGRHGAWQDYPWDDWSRMFQLNMISAAELLHRLWGDLTAVPGRGAINVASAAGFQPIPWFAAYAATKAFLRSLSNGLAAEASAAGTRLLSLCPGPTVSEFGQAAGTDFRVMKARMPVEPVVRTALDAYERGRRELVPGLLNKVLAITGSRAPLGFVVRASAKWARRQGPVPGRSRGA